MTTIRDTKDLGEFIRRTRKARGYTQIDLAELAGVGVVYLGNLERGKETAEIGKALHILQLLSVDLEAIDRQERSEKDVLAKVSTPRAVDAASMQAIYSRVLGALPESVRNAALLGRSGDAA